MLENVVAKAKEKKAKEKGRVKEKQEENQAKEAESLGAQGLALAWQEKEWVWPRKQRRMAKVERQVPRGKGTRVCATSAAKLAISKMNVGQKWGQWRKKP